MASRAHAPERLAVVTGGSHGLGRSLCQAWQAAGFEVIEMSRTAPWAQSVKVDLSDPQRSAVVARDVFAAIDTRSLREFVFVGNAATVEPLGPASGQPADALLRSLNVNLVSAIVLVAAAVARFQACAARKVIAGVTSGAADRVHAGLSVYGAAKAGMEQFMRNLAAEQTEQPHPFLAVSVDPGALDTAMQARLRGAAVADYPAAPDMARRHAQGELADPQAIAAAVVALLRAPTLAQGARLHVRAAGQGSAA